MKKNKKWFTLIELIVVISLLAIITIASTKMNFNKNIEKQNSLMFANEIHSNIEMIRNNSLLWKWVSDGIDIIHPTKWNIHISTWIVNTWNHWIIKWQYSTGWTFAKYNDFEVKFIDTHSYISKLTCYDINKTTSSTQNNIDIEVIGSTLSFSWCTAPNNKILEIQSEYKSFRKKIRLNSLNGVIEKVDN